MCGIFGIVNNENDIVDNLIQGLKFLEYRGYDSAGISILNNGKFQTVKSVGKVDELEKAVKSVNLKGKIGITHSRWATHGGVTEANAHPHVSSDNALTLVHNGIIENYKELKINLIKDGWTFKSETDTEVFSNLIAKKYKELKDHKKAILKSLKEVVGAFGIGVIFADDEQHIYCSRRGSPLLLGLGKNANYLSSGLSAFSGLTNKIISLGENELAIISKDNYEIFDENEKIIKKEVETISIDNINVDKGDFEYFMLKEIYETPKVVEQTIKEYIDITNKKVLLPKFDFDLAKVEKLNIVSCGTSYYSSFVAKYFIEQVAKVNVDIDVASEFRYKNPILSKNDFSIFISQSGETADTIGALKVCKDAGQKIISIVNVLQSNMAQSSDIVLKTLAGVEIGVASTKAFTGQLLVLYIFGIELAFLKKNINKTEYEKYINDLITLSKILDNFLKNEKNIENIKNIAKNVSEDNYYMFIGRNIYYPLALEGSLKLKELGYIPCEGIGAGELKHGPIAIIDKNTHIFAINPTNELFEKTNSNIEEIVARGGKVILISDKNGVELLKEKIVESIIVENSDNKMISAINAILPIQLLAYYISLAKGNNADKPRNLAKSVTVE
jgi:glucosamine--fructose-6-phosphate aminotransferase (isomerizing)